MKSKEERARLLEQYKEIKVEAGVYQIRNTANGKILVDSSLNLKSLNGRSLSLQLGTDMNKQLQKEWNDYGSEAFVMEVLEIIKPSANPYFDQRDELKKHVERWIEKLQPYGDRGYHTQK